jgi:putative flippase GtrA
MQDTLPDRTERRRTCIRRLAVFVTVAAGVVVDVLLRGHAFVENLIAAIMLGAFVIGIAWIVKLADARLKRK